MSSNYFCRPPSPVCSIRATLIPPWLRAVPKGSLQTLEEGLSSSVSPQQDLGSLCLSSAPSPSHRRPGPTIAFDLQATRGLQRSQSNCGCPRQDSFNFSNAHRGTWLQTDCSQTLSSLLLMSLLSLGSLTPPLVRKRNSRLAGSEQFIRPEKTQTWFPVHHQGRWRGEDSDFRDRRTRKDRWNTRCLCSWTICISELFFEYKTCLWLRISLIVESFVLWSGQFSEELDCLFKGWAVFGDGLFQPVSGRVQPWRFLRPRLDSDDDGGKTTQKWVMDSRCWGSISRMTRPKNKKKAIKRNSLTQRALNLCAKTLSDRWQKELNTVQFIYLINSYFL